MPTTNPLINKFLVAAVAALGIAAVSMADGIMSVTEWITVGIGALNALGVYTVSNATSTDDTTPGALWTDAEGHRWRRVES